MGHSFYTVVGGGLWLAIALQPPAAARPPEAAPITLNEVAAVSPHYQNRRQRSPSLGGTGRRQIL